MQGTLCYLSLHDNRHLRYLRGHSKPVCAMDISPIDDAVISGSLDNTVRLWDLRVSECVAKIRYAPTPRPCVAFDPMGVLFALTAPPNVLKLFNLKQLGLGPFDEFCIPILESLEPNSSIEPAQLYATSCTFDPSGCFVMIMYNDGSAYVLDAFTGETRHIFRTSRDRRILDARLGGCFTPDSQYVLMGTETGSIYCWKMETGELVHKWTNIHPGPICCLEFNPAYFNMVASCNHLSMWLSDENKLRDEA
ncbi:WD repeat-containing protein 82-like [Schistocerca gregaria]|uniref:WD repeat-containing protein 82-like n=1 Tax=Schistocerca gregaria TaxID=7010 RepID=UPI00211E71B5|nr:WD repeat-containing protein 82-like [Schistocerca gregaria]